MSPEDFKKELIDLDLAVYKDDVSRWVVREDCHPHLDKYITTYYQTSNKILADYTNTHSYANSYCCNHKVKGTTIEYVFIDENVKKETLQKLVSLKHKQQCLKENIIQYINYIAEL